MVPQVWASETQGKVPRMTSSLEEVAKCRAMAEPS